MTISVISTFSINIYCASDGPNKLIKNSILCGGFTLTERSRTRTSWAVCERLYIKRIKNKGHQLFYVNFFDWFISQIFYQFYLFNSERTARQHLDGAEEERPKILKQFGKASIRRWMLLDNIKIQYIVG